MGPTWHAGVSGHEEHEFVMRLSTGPIFSTVARENEMNGELV